LNVAVKLVYVCVCEGGYIGLWAWLYVSVSSGWSRVRNRVVSDPRFEVILPRPLRHVLQWFFKLDSKVNNSQCYFCLQITSLFWFYRVSKKSF